MLSNPKSEARDADSLEPHAWLLEPATPQPVNPASPTGAAPCGPTAATFDTAMRHRLPSNHSRPHARPG